MNSLPAGNRAAVLLEPGKVAMEDRPVVAPGAGDVLVCVRSVGVCGSDVHYFRHGRIGSFVVESPLILGHEASGVVVAVGGGVSPDLEGQRVALEPGIPCGRCTSCRRGQYNVCPDVRFFATPPIDGAFTQYVTVPAAFVYPLPDNLSDAAGALIEPLAVAVAATRKAGVQPGDRVLVTGAGPIGNLCAQVALARGAAVVTSVDVSPQRLARVARLGVDTVDGTSSWADELEAQADVLLECTGVPTVVSDGLRALGPGGRAVLVGMGAHDDVAIPMPVVMTRELTITGLFRYANCHPAAIGLASSGHVDLDGLVDRTYSLDEVEKALTTAVDDPNVLKVVVQVSAC
jgi:L-iditol 2-dehydrogenase